MSAREPTNPPSSTAGQVTSSTYCFPHASAPGRSLRACRSLWESRSWFASPSLPLARSLCSFPVPSFFLSFFLSFYFFFLLLKIIIVIIYLLWFGGGVFWSPTTARALGGDNGGRWRQPPGPPRTPGGKRSPEALEWPPRVARTRLGSAWLGPARPGWVGPAAAGDAPRSAAEPPLRVCLTQRGR